MRALTRADCLAWLQSVAASGQSARDRECPQPTLSRFLRASATAHLHDGQTRKLEMRLHAQAHQALQRPLVATPPESRTIAGYLLRSGNTACVNTAAEFLRLRIIVLARFTRCAQHSAAPPTKSGERLTSKVGTCRKWHPRRLDVARKARYRAELQWFRHSVALRDVGRGLFKARRSRTSSRGDPMEELPARDNLVFFRKREHRGNEDVPPFHQPLRTWISQ